MASAAHHHRAFGRHKAFELLHMAYCRNMAA
jgi:hypothetical protein